MSIKARQTREGIALFKAQAAATARDTLATAGQVWMKSEPLNEEEDIAFEAALLATGTITEDDIVESIEASGEDAYTVKVFMGDGTVVEINVLDGNSIRGEAE